MSRILIATQNKGKLKEIKHLLGDMDLALITPAQIKLQMDILEDGKTYQENAIKKAQAYAKVSELLTLADDTGLEVDALGGMPGIYSARYSEKPGATDSDRRIFLLEQLQPHPRPWNALFRCIVAIHDPKSGTYLAEGICAGEIIPEERGEHGFGYDPIFKIGGLDRTMAELSIEEKNQLSHRARAIHSIKPIISRLLAQQKPPSNESGGKKAGRT